MPIEPKKAPPAKEPKAKKAEPKESPRTAPSGATSRALPLESKLKQLFVAAAGGAEMAGDNFVANVLEYRAGDLAHGWARLAQENPRVKAFLTTLLEGSAWSEALIPTLAVGVAIAWHFGYAPERIGVPMALGSVNMEAGQFPMSREVEVEFKAGAQKAAAETMRKEAEAQAAAEHKAQDVSNTD
jgi:hypothetical protein